MTPCYADDLVTLYNADCLAVLAVLADVSVDAVVTDPPYGLGFMGKAWDALPPGREWAAECLRVLKPGGHLLAFGGTRTAHRLACAIEDAGFEIRDTIAWLYGSGFPKSLDVSKAIDKAAGVEREVVGSADRKASLGSTGILGVSNLATAPAITAPATDDARTWQGWGTALKPANEPIIVARKAPVGTVAANVLAYGTGALNIDACRTGDDTSRGDRYSGKPPSGTAGIAHNGINDEPWDVKAGRWPTNAALAPDAAAELDKQSGDTTRYFQAPRHGLGKSVNGSVFGEHAGDGIGYADSGGASRYFPTFRYEAKASSDERPSVDGVLHPTVKPLDLMRWLVRLVTPPGGLVLEPFAGSGTTAEACVIEGFRCIAIEREADYLPLIKARLSKPIQPDIFGGVA